MFVGAGYQAVLRKVFVLISVLIFNKSGDKTSVMNCELEMSRMMGVKESGLKLQAIGMRVGRLKLKQSPVQESLRSEVTSNLVLSLLSKITFMFEQGEVKLLIVTV